MIVGCGISLLARVLYNAGYKNIIAVDNISFKIEQGEIVGFIGSNGAGKTTTLKILCGLIHPSHGSLEVAGHNPFLRQKSYGYLF